MAVVETMNKYFKNSEIFSETFRKLSKRFQKQINNNSGNSFHVEGGVKLKETLKLKNVD